MGSGFKGRYPAQFDAKGRVAVPAKLRRSAPGGKADQFVITLGLDRCLFLFAPDKWDQIVTRIQEVSFTTERAKFLTRMIASHAEDVELDGQSRIIVPQPLVAKAGLEKEVLFVGVLNRIEIWHPESFEKYLQGSSETYEQAAGEFLL